MKENDKHIRELLQQNWQLLQNSLYTLNLSVEKVQNIMPKEEHTFEEMESFDSLTSKFGRASDIYTQKVIRTIWMLLHEPFEPFIDMMNRSEKIGLIKSADEMIDIRDTRNQITHEYIPEAIQELVPEVIRLAKNLEENINCTRDFVGRRDWNIDL
jgi:hypothetical protein